MDKIIRNSIDWAAVGIQNPKECILEIESVAIEKKSLVLRLVLVTNFVLSLKVIDNIKKTIMEEIDEVNDVVLEIKYKGLVQIKEVWTKLFLENLLEDAKQEYPHLMKTVFEDQIKISEDCSEILIPCLGDLVACEMNKVVSPYIQRAFMSHFQAKNNVVFENHEGAYQQTAKDKEKIIETERKLQAEQSKNQKSQARKSGGEQSYTSKRASKPINQTPTKIKEVNLEMETVVIEGLVCKQEIRITKTQKTLLSLVVSDFTESIRVKAFLSGDKAKEIPEITKEGCYIKARGNVVFDTFETATVIMAKDVEAVEKPVSKRTDDSKGKRVEFHAHTKMSAMDGLSDVKDLVKKAAQWGHPAIAITDHGVVQAFPDAAKAGKSAGIKVIYGVEGYLVNDLGDSGESKPPLPLDGEYVVFDLETTGLSAVKNEIIEIGAVRIKNREITESFQRFVKPKCGRIPYEIVNLTGISDEMVEHAEGIENVFDVFLEFAGDVPLVAHNASFDMSFMREVASRRGISLKNREVDTLYLSRVMLKDLKKHKLNLVADYFDIDMGSHHRADDDAKTTGQILLKMFEIMEEHEVLNVNDAAKIHGNTIEYKNKNTNHIIILAQNYIGLKNLYELISASHMNYFYKKPRIPKSILIEKKEGLLIGGACQDGEIYQSILNKKSQAEIESIASFYDYLEVQPLKNNEFLIHQNKVEGRENLIQINKDIIALGEKLGKPVIATSDAHYIEPEQAVYRQILMAGQGYKDVDGEDGLYIRTTKEMLEEFDYLDAAVAKKIVIENPNLLADSIQELQPVPKEKFPPKIAGSEELLEKLCNDKATAIYGLPLPQIVESRLRRELNSIISNGYAVMYIISHKLVKKSMEDGYLVGSRGSVGSSFAATMSGITEVNPLPPHYICPNCKNNEFIHDGSYGCGVDMPKKNCPKCGTEYINEGFDIPFEVFLGFEGDKEPDIDLNFAGEYQGVAHKYIEELFGKDHVFRAGTIGTIAEKTAYGFVMKYFEQKGEAISKWETERLASGCTGVRRTTGQHPGGIIIVPKDNDIHEFCPVQHPANDSSSGVITTHFDYHSIDQNLLKLDILGHDAPSMIRMFEDITGVNPGEIPLKDEKVDSLFHGVEALDIKVENFPYDKGSLGIPEFGTKFVRQMLEDTKPQSFSDLVRIAGLSHGTNVWLNNAQELVLSGTAVLKEVISTRDDIMNFLILNGVPSKDSFKIMENVRKGKGIKEDEAKLMEANNIPQWYIESCRKIEYMFPKAHAVAYVMMSYRVAYFKVYYPLAFYAVFFTMKVADFNSEVVLGGIPAIGARIKEIEDKGRDAMQKEKDEVTVLEVAYEMYARGYEAAPVRLEESDAVKFKVADGNVLLPYAALNGVGENAAKSLAEEVKKGEFMSIDDMKVRAKLNKTAIEALSRNGVLKGMPESNQLSFFSAF